MLKLLLKHTIADHAIDSFFSALERNFSQMKNKNMCYGSDITHAMDGKLVTVNTTHLRNSNQPPIEGFIEFRKDGFKYLVDPNTNHSLGIIRRNNEIYY